MTIFPSRRVPFAILTLLCKNHPLKTYAMLILCSPMQLFKFYRIVLEGYEALIDSFYGLSDKILHTADHFEYWKMNRFGPLNKKIEKFVILT